MRKDLSMNCPKCGALNAESSLRCYSCGIELHHSDNQTQKLDVNVGAINPPKTSRDTKLVCIKRKLINALRWLGAIVLPILAAMLVGIAIIIIGTKFYIDQGNVVRRGQVWGAIEDFVLKPILEPFVIPVVAWYCAPKCKFRAAILITGFYVTLFLGMVLRSLYLSTPSDHALLELVGIPIGLAAGILWIRKLDRSSHVASR